MNRILLYSLLLVAAAGVFAWRLWSKHSNKGRAIQILYWIERALGGHGHVTGIRWITDSEFEVPLRLVSNVFMRATVRIKIAGRAFPLVHLRHKAADQAETLTFRADLDYRPGFNLDVNNMRWFARSRKDNDLNALGWEFESCAPVVLTTRLDWEKEPTSAMQTMIGLEQKEDVEVTFRRTSPHFCVTLPLAKIDPGSEIPVFDLLNSIAACSSAKAS